MKRIVTKMERILLSVIFFLISFAASSQNITVNGIVTDINNDPVIGATISISGETRGTSTDINGKYTLVEIPPNATLIVSFVGMETQSIPVNGRTTVNVVLLDDSELLEEVVVIGYGAMRREDLTGAVAQVQPRELQLAPVASFDEALAGRMAGVQVSFADGQPGTLSGIVIRGASSLTQDNSPLYVVDGVPLEDPDNAALNPEEIASMTVLKDASATAIYGSRAANGVIIIETKQGIEAKPVITFNTSIGVQSPIKLMDMMKPYDFVLSQILRNRNTYMRLYTPVDLPIDDEYYNPDGRSLEDYKNIEGINWQKMILNTEPVQSYNLSIRGKSLGTSYSISGSVHNQKGIILNSGFKRYQGRINLTQELTRKLKLSVNGNYSQTERFGHQVNEGGGGNFTTSLLYRAWVYRPVSGNPNIDLTEFEDDPEHTNASDVRLNPYITSLNDYDRRPASNFSVNGTIDYNITKDLSLKLIGAYNSNKSSRERFYNSKTPQGSPYNRSQSRGVNANINFSEFNGFSSENTLTYKKTFRKSHNIILVGGMSFNDVSSSSFGFATQQIPNETLGMYGMEEGIPLSTSASGGENSMLSYFGRLDYNYMSKYMLTATVRSDGSSKFSKNNRWGQFPSAAMAWNLKGENFMKNIRLINEAKLRFSYGLTGNNRVGNYDYLMKMSLPLSASYSYGNASPIQGIIPSTMGNDALKWETTGQTNIGADLGLFRNRIQLSADWYKKITNDLLLLADIPATTGQVNIYNNIGSIRNSGLEFTITTRNVSSPNFSWNTNFNISFNENKILELTRDQTMLFTQVTVTQHSTPLYLSKVGAPAGMFYGYIFDGIYQIEDFDSPTEGVYQLKSHFPTNGNERSSIQPGDIRYKDLNNDGDINSQDMTIIGRGQPIHYGGLTNNFYYKGFSLNIFFQWSYGNNIFNANRTVLDGSFLSGLNSYASYEWWTPENRSNTHFRPLGFGPPGYQSTRVLEDGSYLRLKTLSLGYSIPQKITERLSIRNITLRVAFQNLLTFTNYSGMDPEVGVMNPVLSPGYDYSAYPQAKTMTFSLNLTL